MERNEKSFHELVAVEYNETGVSSYDDNAWSHLSAGRTILPSKFQSIDRKKSCESFKLLANECDI